MVRIKARALIKLTTFKEVDNISCKVDDRVFDVDLP